MLFKYSLAAAILWAQASLVLANPPLVEAAFANMAPIPDEHWSFTQSSTDDSGTTTERCENIEGTREWTLVSVNGSPPSEKDIKKYREKKQAQEESRQSADKKKFDTLAEPGSIELLEENELQSVYSFVPFSENEDDRKINQQLQGRLVVSKTGPFVRSFELMNTDTVAPAALVKIHKMHIRMSFAPLTTDGPYLPKSMTTEIQGKLGGLKKISEEKHIQFSEYSRVPQSP